MLRRLLAFLLLLALSAPALVMSGHCATPARTTTMHAMPHGGGHQPAPAQVERRDCIGCVLPDLGAVTMVKPAPPAMLPGGSRRGPALSSQARRPDLRPPRT
jgi:hypothetical protein